MNSQSENKNNESDFSQLRHHPVAVLVMMLIFVALVSATAWRSYASLSPISTEFDWTNRGFSDFHNGTYLPTQAFIAGQSPYSAQVAEEYQIARETPPYSPIIFILHIPFALLSIDASRALFYAFSIAMYGMISYCCLRMSEQPFRWFDFLAITNLLIFSRPGQQTLFTGYFTAEVALGCFVALHFANKRPALSGCGLILASFKPNFILPICMLMLFRKNFKAVGLGVLFCGISSVAGFGWLAIHNGVGSVIKAVLGGQEALHVDPTEMPINTWTRTDLVGMYAKLTDWVPGDEVYLGGMLVMLSLVGIVLFKWNERQQDHQQQDRLGAAGLSGLVICLAMLLGMYHHVYDCLLLAVPCFGLVYARPHSAFDAVPEFWRKVVIGLIAVVGLNYLSTKSVMELLSLEPLSFVWQAVTLINGLCLAVALIILLACMVSQLATGKVDGNS